MTLRDLTPARNELKAQPLHGLGNPLPSHHTPRRRLIGMHRMKAAAKACCVAGRVWYPDNKQRQIDIPAAYQDD